MGKVLTRRAALTAFSAATVAAAIVPAAALASTSGRVSDVAPELSALIADYWATDAVIDRFYDEVFNPACERQHERYNAVPHVVQPITPMGEDTREREWSTAIQLDVACVAGIVKLSRGPALLSQGPGNIRRCEARSFWAAHLRRERALERIKNDPEIVAARSEEDRLWAPQRVREAAIEQYPVSTLADLRAKIDFMHRRDAELRADLLPLLAADVARIIEGEA